MYFGVIELPRGISLISYGPIKTKSLIIMISSSLSLGCAHACVLGTTDQLATDSAHRGGFGHPQHAKACFIALLSSQQLKMLLCPSRSAKLRLEKLPISHVNQSNVCCVCYLMKGWLVINKKIMFHTISFIILHTHMVKILHR